MPAVTRFAVVGAGFRARAFVRLAESLPEHFEVVAVLPHRPGSVRDDDGLSRLVVGDVDALAARAPEFVLTAVAADANVATALELVGRRIPVLAETPAAPDLDGLRVLWQDAGARELMQIAEQYPRHPMTAARIAAIEAGRIGTPTSVAVTIAQAYHSIAILRAALDPGFGEVDVRAVAHRAPLVAPRSRAGWTRDDEEHAALTVLATLDFGASQGVYEFTDGQTRNPLRPAHFRARGSRGEILDDAVVSLADETTVVHSRLIRHSTGADGDFEAYELENVSLDGAALVRNPFVGARLSDDEIGMAALLEAMGRFARGEGPGPYPLRDGAQDQLLGLAVQRAVDSGEPVHLGREAWAS
jgi:predicted dehydrogenase